jgi:hypothetical protein
MLTATRVRDERGLIVVWFTILLTVMIGLAALVVDLGAGREKSRQAQNAADAAALGAAQNLPNLTTTVSAAQSLGNTNVSGATLAWSTCTDSGHLAQQTTPASCISFDNTFTKVRVRLPQQTLPSLFGGIFGVKSLSVGKAAEAQVVRADVGGATIPFALYSGTGGVEVCLVTSSQDCGSSTSGNFGPLDIETYLAGCAGPKNANVSSNIATGIDHVLTKYLPPVVAGWPSAIVDACYTPGPNTVDTRTGAPANNDFDPGMLDDNSGYGPAGTTPALLQQGPFIPKVSVAGNMVDNKPLSEFISADTSLSNVPTSCKSAAFPPGLPRATLHARIMICITEYESGAAPGCTGPCTGVVFGRNSATEAPIDVYDIQQSPRFVEIPQMWELTAPTGSSSPVHIKAFQPFFLQRLFGKHGLDFEPGQWNLPPNPPPPGDTAQAVSAFRIPAGMLPPNVGDPNVIGTTSYVQLVR